MNQITTVYALRHARAASGDFENMARPLAPAGEEQARNLVPFLSTLQLSAIYTSPFQRAISTVTPFAQASGLPVHGQPDLREGEPEETLDRVQQRIVGFVQASVRAHRGDSILLCTHGGILFGLLSFFVPSFGYEDYLKIGNPDLRRFVFTAEAGCYDADFRLPQLDPTLATGNILK